MCGWPGSGRVLGGMREGSPMRGLPSGEEQAFGWGIPAGCCVNEGI